MKQEKQRKVKEPIPHCSCLNACFFKSGFKSDPELESQINDRISFKSFLSLPMDCPSPDHSTFSRFRKRLSKEAMIKTNSELLNQFHQQGLSINEGLAVDARLVKSASRPVSNEQLDELKKKANTLEGKLDKNGQVKKYTRDLESDWTIKNDKPHYGLKEHASVDTDNGFILSTTLTRKIWLNPVTNFLGEDHLKIKTIGG